MHEVARRVLTMVALAAAQQGCGAPPDEASGGPALELGRDVQSAFVPLDHGEDVAIERGNQGGVHLALAVRTDAAPGPLWRLSVILADADGDTIIASSRYMLRLDGATDEAGFRVEPNILAVLPSEDSAIDRDIAVVLELDEDSGDDDTPAARDERVVHCLAPGPP